MGGGYQIISEKASEFSQNIHAASKSSGRAQIPVQVSINCIRRDNGAIIPKNTCCFLSIISNNPGMPDRQVVKEIRKLNKRKRDREPSRIPVRRIMKLIKRKGLEVIRCDILLVNISKVSIYEEFYR